MQQTYPCAKCGAPIAFGMSFCGNCGTQLNWPTQQQVQPPPQYNQYQYQQQQWPYGYQQQRPKQQLSSWILVTLLLAGIILLVVGGIFLGAGLLK